MHSVQEFLPPLRGSICILLPYPGLRSRLSDHFTHGYVPVAAMRLEICIFDDF
jgi:hypothetical protein